MILPVKMNDFNYDVVIEKGCINNVNEYLVEDKNIQQLVSNIYNCETYLRKLNKTHRDHNLKMKQDIYYF